MSGERTEWGIQHWQGIAECRSEREALERLPGFVASYRSNFRNKVEPRVVSRTVTDWTTAPDEGTDQ